MFQYGNISLDQELLNVHRILKWRIVVVKQPQFVLPQLLKHILQDFLIELLIDHLALWQELAVDDAVQIDEHDQRHWLLILTVLFYSALVRTEISTDCFGIWFPAHTQKPVSHHQWWPMKQVWFSLKMLDNVLMHLHAMLLLIIIQQVLAPISCRLPTYPNLQR